MSLETADRLAIHELLSLHGHLVDEGRLSEEDLRLLFTDDVRYDVSALGGAVLVGLGAVRDASLALGDRNPLAHLVTNIVVQAEDSGDRATVRSKGLGVLSDGTVGAVTYVDDVVRTPAGWRIEERRVVPRRTPLTP